MVNDAITLGVDPSGGHPERALALGYAPPRAGKAVAALFALDRTLARVTLGTREAMVARLRLAWWDDALRGQRAGEAEGQPILRALAEAGVDGGALVPLVEGWQRLFEVPDDTALLAFAADRAMLFDVAARAAGARDATGDAGRGWALADLAAASGDATLARRAGERAIPLLATAAAQRWSRPGRFLGALVHVARADLADRSPVGAPRRVARLAWFRLTGR